MIRSSFFFCGKVSSCPSGPAEREGPLPSAAFKLKSEKMIQDALPGVAARNIERKPHVARGSAWRCLWRLLGCSRVRDHAVKKNF
jgi:hypothetical protein